MILLFLLLVSQLKFGGERVEDSAESVSFSQVLKQGICLNSFKCVQKWKYAN